jgi:sodium/proline symporter
MEFLILTAFIIYFCILTGIGLFFYLKKKKETASEFISGGRSINYFVTAIATQASDMSSWLFLGVPAIIYTSGMPGAWLGIGLILGMFLSWQFIAPKLRAATEHYNSLTLSSYFESRYRDTSGTLRLLSAIFTLLFFTFYIASSLVGLGRLFESAFGLSYTSGIILGLLSAILYTLLGGFVAIAWCDTFQGLFLLAAIVIVPAYTLYLVGGWSVVMTVAASKGVPTALVSSWSMLIDGLLLAASWGLGYFGQPHILTNFMAIDDVKNIKYAKYVGIAWQIMAVSAAVSIGLISVTYFDTPLANPELAFIILAKGLFTPLLTGFILCGILAATLSTLDRFILISGSVIAQDMYKKLFNQQASSELIMKLSRIGSVVASCIGLYIARNDSNSVYDLVLYSWSGLGSSFGPLIIMSLYTNMVTRAGAIAGLLAGGITSGIWPYLGTGITPLVPGFGAGLLAILVASKIKAK